MRRRCSAARDMRRGPLGVVPNRAVSPGALAPRSRLLAQLSLRASTRCRRATRSAEARSSKFRHVITKSIGFERNIEADVKSIPVSAGDCFVLCSDGMSNYVEHGELEQIVASISCRNLPIHLIQLANDRGGDDNITVVVGLVADVPPA